MFWKIFSTTWFWKISMWPRYYQHILASVIRYVRTKWAAANKCCGVFLTHWFGQVHLGITASKENTVAFFQFKYAELSGYAHFFRFRPQIPFLGKFGPTFKTTFKYRMDHSHFLMPYLADALPFMVIFWSMLWHQRESTHIPSFRSLLFQN